MKFIIFKNIVVSIIVAASYFFISREFENLPPESLNTLTLFVGLIIIAPLFANFSFSYQFLQKRSGVWLGHTLSFLAMLITGILLVMLDVLLLRLAGNIVSFRTMLALFWVTILIYDFWDYARLKKA